MRFKNIAAGTGLTDAIDADAAALTHDAGAVVDADLAHRTREIEAAVTPEVVQAGRADATEAAEVLIGTEVDGHVTAGAGVGVRADTLGGAAVVGEAQAVGIYARTGVSAGVRLTSQ